MLLWDKHWQIPEELLVAGPTSCRSFWYVKQAFVLYINSELYSTFVISCQETVILFADGKEKSSNLSVISILLQLVKSF